LNGALVGPMKFAGKTCRSLSIWAAKQGLPRPSATISGGYTKAKSTLDAGTYLEHITLTEGVSIYGQGWDKTIIDGGFSAAQSTVRIPAVSTSTVLSGVQVTDGGTGDPATPPNGGGISVSGSPRIANTWVYGSTGCYGGGVYMELADGASLVSLPSRAKPAGRGAGY
jgi:hypothetical protein